MATLATNTKHLRLDWVAAPNPYGRRGFRSALSTGYNADKSVEYVCYGVGYTAILAPIDNPGQAIVFTGHKVRVTAVAISPNGAYVASGDEKGTVIVWKFDAKQEIVNTYMVCETAVSDIRWNSKSDMFVAGGGSRRNYAYVYRVSSQNSVGKIDKITGNVLSVDFSPAGDAVVTVDENNELNAYPKFEHGFRVKKHSRYPNVVRYRPDAAVVATASSDSTVILYDAKTFEVTNTIGGPECKDGHNASIYGFAWSPCGTKFVTCAADRTVKVWDAAAGTVLNTWTVSAHPDVVQNQQCAVSWTASNKIVSLAVGGFLSVFEESKPESEVKLLVRPGSESAISFVATSKVTGKVYSGDSEGCLAETDGKSGVTTWLGARLPAGGSSGAITHDGQTLYVGTGMTIYKVDLETKSATESSAQVVTTLESEVVKVVCSSTKAGLLAVILNNGTLAIINDGSVVNTTTVRANDVAFKGDDSELAVAVGGDRRVRTYTIGEDFSLTHKADSADDNGCPLDFVTYFNDWVISNQGAQLNIFKPEKFDVLANPGWTFHNERISAGKVNPSKSHMITVSKDRQIIVWRELESLRPRNRIIMNCSPAGIVRVDWIDDTTFVTLDVANFIKCWTVL